MEMHNTASRGSNPDAAIAVPEKVYPFEVARRGGVRKLRFQFPVPESSEPSRQRNQKGSIAGLIQVWYHGRPKWHVIEPGGPGPPSPNSVRRHNPEHVVAIFIQATHPLTEGAVRSMTVNIRSIDRAELSRRDVNEEPPTQTVPLRSSRIEAISKPARSGYRVSLPSLQLAKPPIVPIQKVPIAGDMEVHDKITGKLFAIQRWLPMLDADTVEPKQPETSAQPDVAIWRLRNCPNVRLA